MNCPVPLGLHRAASLVNPAVPSYVATPSTVITAGITSVLKLSTGISRPAEKSVAAVVTLAKNS